MIVEPAPAKLNLALHVRARRADGYHELETLFAFAADGDEVRVSIARQPAFAVVGPFAAALADGGDNLVLRAGRAFAAAFGIAATHDVTLDKRLPVASGIGGGSADAAAMLRALARLHGVESDPRLQTIAAGLGADVPACLLGRAAFGTARGDALAAIEGVGNLPALLVNPGVAVATASVFARWDGIDRGAIPAGETLARALAGRNDLQPAAEAVAPVVRDVIALLTAQPGVLLARMSGSGATCFALFGEEAARDRAAAAVARARPDWWRLSTRVA